jgi:hypothetical protein
MTKHDATQAAGQDNAIIPWDFSWVLPELAVGGRFPPEAVEDLACRFVIRRVVDLREEDRDDVELLRCHRIELLHLPTPDTLALSQEMLWRGVRWVREGLDRGDRALIHCEHGIGRSALLACSVLVSSGHSPHAALELAKNARERVSPSPSQLHALLQWSADWHRQQRTPCPPSTWDELARVAYRHLARLSSKVSS